MTKQPVPRGNDYIFTTNSYVSKIYHKDYGKNSDSVALLEEISNALLQIVISEPIENVATQFLNRVRQSYDFEHIFVVKSSTLKHLVLDARIDKVHEIKCIKTFLNSIVNNKQNIVSNTLAEGRIKNKPFSNNLTNNFLNKPLPIPSHCFSTIPYYGMYTHLKSFIIPKSSIENNRNTQAEVACVFVL